MDELIKKTKKIALKRKVKKTNKEAKIVAKVNEEGNVEVLGVSGNQSALLSTICAILHEMEKHSEDSAENMAKIILIALKMEKEMND